MFNTFQVAKQWRVSVRHLAKWVQAGRLIPDVGREQWDVAVWRFSAATLNSFHQAHGFDAVIMPLFAEGVPT